MRPQADYARNGDVSIAWAAIGEGPIDVVVLMGGLSHIEHLWEEPGLTRWFERLAQFSRVILVDRRGVGLSDRVNDDITLDDECGDVTAVLDAAGSTRAVLFGYTWGGPLCIRYARLRPERVRAMVLYACVATATIWTEDFDREIGWEERIAGIEESIGEWGTTTPLPQVAPSRVGDVALESWFRRLARLSSSPGAMRTLWRSTSKYDARADLAEVRVPSLILHRSGDRAIDVRHSRYIAAQIPGARYVELDGIDSLPSVGDSNALIAEIEEFLTGTRRRSVERALLTVVVTDIVDSTGHASRLGDERWRDLLAAHDNATRHEIDRFEGREVKALGDGFLIAFAGAPSQAHRCALAILEAVRPHGLLLRAGVHTGECELIGHDVGGMAVHIATRVAELARPDEVIASGTAYGTVVGSGLRFEDRGSHELRGVPGRWPVMKLVG